MFLKAALLLVALSAVSANTRVNLRPCPNGQRMPEYFESPHCTATRCTLTRGQVFTGTAHVIPDSPFSTLQINLDARVLGIPFELRIPPGYENACDFLRAPGRCPVTANNPYWWELQFPVATTYPTVNNLVITRKWKTEKENSNWIIFISFQCPLERPAVKSLAPSSMLNSDKSSQTANCSLMISFKSSNKNIQIRKLNSFYFYFVSLGFFWSRNLPQSKYFSRFVIVVCRQRDKRWDNIENFQRDQKRILKLYLESNYLESKRFKLNRLTKITER